MAHVSEPDLLVLHAVRLAGFAGTGALAARFGLDGDETRERLLDAEALGWVSRSAFADLAGWSLTEAGRRRNEEQLRAELDSTGARAAVAGVHARFVPLNARACRLFTVWQTGSGEVASTLDPLTDLARALRGLEDDLASRLARFTGYHARFGAALARVAADPAWVTGLDVDSCHRVWFELHEDLVATLGTRR